LPCY